MTDTYTQGHSKYTTSTQERRTAESSAAFLLPYIKNTDYILDAGCGPGSITIGLAKYPPEGKTVGIDSSKEVLIKATALAAEANVSTDGLGSVTFEHGNILEGLSYPDSTFDIIFASQIFGHIPPPDQPVKSLVELRRVLKPGGILATRDGVGAHFYPPSLDLNRLWVQNSARGYNKGAPPTDPTGKIRPSLLRRAGFDIDGGKVKVGAGADVFAGKETRQWLGWRAAGQLREGDAVYQSWLDAGITKDEIQETLDAVEKWVDMEDAWYAALQCEMLAWK